MPMQIGEDEILSMIKNESVFKSCYRSFLRDIKIDGILS
jgi:hypothetical protein